MTIRRVHVIGVPGSGKTTLAAQVAERLGTEARDLDFVFYEGGSGSERPEGAARADIRKIARQPVWVTEGAYRERIDELLSGADVIVWLDVPRWLAHWRMVKRHVQASVRGVNRHRGLRKLWRFLRFVHGRYETFELETERVLEPYMSKVVRVRIGGRSALDRVVNQVTSSGET